MRYKAEDLTIETKISSGQLHLLWRGRSEGRNPREGLAPVMEEMRRAFGSASSVEFDFRSVEYMNSSTIRPILELLQSASSNSETVRVRYDGSKNWQRLSFQAIGAVLATLGNVEMTC